VIYYVRPGEVRKAIQSSKSEALGSPIHLLPCFGPKKQKQGFKKNDLVPKNLNNFFKFKKKQFKRVF
jgi:hypothetical protein